MRVVIGILFVILLSFSVGAVELSDYPEPFIRHGKINTLIVLGDYAAAEDVIGSIDIAANLQYYLEEAIPRGIAVLASEVRDVKAQNLIVVGGPCVNNVAAELMGYPKNCGEGFQLGKGVLQLFDHGHTYSLLVAGMSAADTKRAALVLSHPSDFELTGDKMIVSGAVSSGVQIG